MKSRDVAEGKQYSMRSLHSLKIRTSTQDVQTLLLHLAASLAQSLEDARKDDLQHVTDYRCRLNAEIW